MKEQARRRAAALSARRERPHAQPGRRAGGPRGAPWAGCRAHPAVGSGHAAPEGGLGRGRTGRARVRVPARRAWAGAESARGAGGARPGAGCRHAAPEGCMGPGWRAELSGGGCRPAGPHGQGLRAECDGRGGAQPGPEAETPRRGTGAASVCAGSRRIRRRRARPGLRRRWRHRDHRTVPRSRIRPVPLPRRPVPEWTCRRPEFRPPRGSGRR
ncbi:hypothetical protein SAMN04487993_100357 [Salipiger marinus]|uniref:Uncharacterized protein n=1 Tax=Salipiger marinus TaxID=555512 RepID=A0A1G8JGU6_9RHOB|nr:hypothetical protein SAMN04487993_100357 [Salipiger marinus]